MTSYRINRVILNVSCLCTQVAIASKRGATGMILFSDPQDKAKEGRNFTYPDSWWLPGMGVESGSLYVVDGDPLTPSYPAIGKIYFPTFTSNLKRSEVYFYLIK